MFRITVDTGGTFTDVIVSDDAGNLFIGKALTTKEQIFDGVRAAIGTVAAQMNLSASSLVAGCDLLIYGTTRATNAIVTRTTARTAFMTTEGFPDTLLLKEGGRPNAHDYSRDYAQPFIARRDTYELRERVDARGRVVRGLDEGHARSTIASIVERRFEAAAVCLLWSIANPRHELRLAELLDELAPGLPYTLSHRLVPVVREYRRASATAIDASLKPLMQAHLRELEADLRAEGFAGDFLISTTEGGCNHVEALIEKPIYTVGSGPAMAPIAGLSLSSLEGMGNDVIVCDTGGTTFDVGLVREGRLTFTRDTWIGGTHTGDLLGIAAVDMRSIGAGGGSIAWIDDGGLMRVGPQSAGADPGPACYGRGGELPTVSDAAVVLGYLDPDHFLGGRMRLDAAAARAAVAGIAGRFGLTVEQAAFRILSLATELMRQAITDITLNEGLNPRDSTIVAGGGAAGINILAIARELGCTRVVLPKVASALSATGMQFADIVVEETASFAVTSSRFDAAGVNAVLDGLEARLKAFHSGLGDGARDHAVEFVGEARYEGQIWELDTILPRRRFEGSADVEALVEAFHEVHERLFTVRDPGSPVQVINWKARLRVDVGRRPDLSAGAPATVAQTRPGRRRDCWFGDLSPLPTAIYRDGDLFPGVQIAGPAIVEEPTTTLVVPPGMAVRITGAGNYVLNFA